MKTADTPYDEITNERMKRFAARLCEKDRRAYAAVEAYKLGQGGVTRIANLFGMSPETIKRGREDLDCPERLPRSGPATSHGRRAQGCVRRTTGIGVRF